MVQCSLSLSCGVGIEAGLDEVGLAADRYHRSNVGILYIQQPHTRLLAGSSPANVR